MIPLVLAVVLGLVSTYALLLLFAFGAHDFRLTATDSRASPVVVAATLIAGALTAAYAVLRLRAHLLAETRGKLDLHGDARADEKHRSEQEDALVERFSQSVALLAADHAISRIAGAHLILALGDEWPGGAQRCLDVLVSHLRGLRESNSVEDSAVPRGVREEVRLITRGLFFRLSKSEPRWDVRSGDFSGTALDGVELDEVLPFSTLDLREAHIFGSLAIPATSSPLAPLLAGLRCEGDLTIEYAPGWGAVDLSNGSVRGSVSIVGEALAGEFNATGLRAGESLNLSFETFRGDVLLDSLDVQGEVRVGLLELGAAFGLEDAPVDLSLVDASFGLLALQRLTRGPRLNMSGATGSVDLAESVFPFEVTANDLDASSGFSLRGARFGDAFVLDGAKLPEVVDMDGLYLSDYARSAIESSEFPLRARMLGLLQGKASSSATAGHHDFDWRGAIEPLRERAGSKLMKELEGRLTRIEANLPLDWANKASFAAQVASEVSRAVARVGAAPDIERSLQSSLRDLIHPSPLLGGPPK